MIVVRLYKAIDRFRRRINKIRKLYRVMVTIKNIIIKILNLAASSYRLFTSIEPLLQRFNSDTSTVSE